MSAPPLGPSELGARSVYTKELKSSSHSAAEEGARPGPPSPLPSLSRRDLTIKGLRSLLRLRLQARSLGQINTARRGSKARGRGLPHPFPPSLGKPGSSHWSLRPDRLSGRPPSEAGWRPGSAPGRGVGAGTAHAGLRNLLPSTRSRAGIGFFQNQIFFAEGQNV